MNTTTTEPTPSFASVLCARMERAGLTVGALAGLCSVAPRTVTNWRNDHTVPPEKDLTQDDILAIIEDHEKGKETR
jgi:hypothetical protein